MVIAGLEKRSGSVSFALAYIFAGVILTHLVCLALPGVWFLPAFNGAVFFLIFLQPLRRGDYWAAVRLALIWAAVTTLVQILLTLGWPELIGKKIWKGIAYRQEMMTWVRTGTGPEGDIRLFLPIHIKNFVVFIVASLISGGFLGLVMGAALLGHMNFYVGSLLSQAHFSWIALLLSWPVWSVLRVVGYIMLGTALGAVIVHRQGGEKKSKILRLSFYALVLVILDVILKWALAPCYQEWLKAAIGG